MEGNIMQLRTEGDVHIVTVLPRIDANNAKDMDAKLQDVMRGGAKKIICSFTANEYVSSAGLRVFLAALKAMNKTGGRIVLCSLKPYVQEVFEMAGFSQLFAIFATEDEAVQNIK